MPSLMIKSAGFADRVIELNLGINRLGRGPENDFQIDHPTVSAMHCEIVLSGEGLLVRDCGTTNGTFVGRRRIEQATLAPGESLHLGEVELVVEATAVNVTIPKFDVPRPAPPVVLADGSLICPRHPGARATHQCTHCHEVLCDACVHRLQRHRGKLMKLCPLCSYPCAPLGAEKQPKQSFFKLWSKTVKLPFIHRSRPREEA
jgi:pSer/pThr/pTyr-binding forkhead associated (FHA) protein